ncbi:GlxA family transcriptional regulator [Rhizobium sp. P44RR-XXIV]|uniref:GlxA family transcriptional regulator n=1 Tax=Rhizobium sp. P44RR-XXIV TaxID=1921145 RepID=UPI000985C179|nr:GlxA family transcriptional regulator [Rhizobium sp. P44RR-XXIV]TIX86701.1 GlxA family transcriptional regulator [Rhizobium sp. P44RR-XXIV]
MHTIGFLVFPDFQIMGFTAITAFEVANLAGERELYRVTLLSEAGGLVRSSAGFSVETEPFGNSSFDSLFIGAATQVSSMSPATLDYIRQSAKVCRRVAAPCTGAFTLAEAGLLDGRRATTHWVYARELRDRFPALKVDEDKIFIIDGSIWTSAGMTATIDLALAMIEKDHGEELARAVAKKLVVYHRRAGGQSQFSTLLELEPKSDRVQRALDFAGRNLRKIVSVEELAEAASLSPRQFNRVFRSETGQSPAKAIENMRVEAARLMIEDGRHSMDEIAVEVGFADRERMRRAFLRVLGQPPQTIRRNVRAVA